MYRETRNYENVQRAAFQNAGAYDIPQIRKDTGAIPGGFIGFNFAKTCKDPSLKGCHFFVDDYQFSRLWTDPDRYIGMLQRFQCVCSPDFSTYTDFPKAVQIWNSYRKHWLGAYWQLHGIRVIPTVSWSDTDSFTWCFDGDPVGGPVAVSSVGTQANAKARELFRAGYHEMLGRLRPSVILFYGMVPEGCEDRRIIHLDTFQNELKARTGGKNDT